MKVKYCLPIQVKSKKKLLSILSSESKRYAYLEIWLDYIEDIEPEFVVGLSKKYKEKLILLFRRQNLEKVKMSSKKRQAIMSSLHKSQSLIDLDLKDQKKELEFIKRKKLKLKLLLSYHNYKKTPSDPELKAILRKMSKFKPEIFKFACFCKGQIDSLRLMKILVELRNRGEKFIVLGMGEKALVTRLFGTKWGNQMLFAPLSKSKMTAKGQFTREKYERIFKLLP